MVTPTDLPSQPKTKKKKKFIFNFKKVRQSKPEKPEEHAPPITEGTNILNNNGKNN